MTAMTPQKQQPSRTRRRLVLASTIALSLSACATRTERSTLGVSWPMTEPTVNLAEYESVQRRPGQRGDVAVAVAISGGGMRAANFAAGVLKALEQTEVRGSGGRRSNLLREVDYFSTVSGGGLAAGSYITHLKEYQRHHPNDVSGRGFSFAAGGEQASAEGRNWRSSLAKNYQSSMLRSLFNPLMLGDKNRGDVLEHRLDEHVLGRHGSHSLTLGDVFVKRGTTPLLPYWVTNGTVYENGAIFPFTPDVLRKYQITGYKHRMASCKLERAEDMPLAVGLKTSASFPAAIPPTTMKSDRDPNNPQIHLMDGGVADNLGVITAIRLLNQDRAKKKVLIIIDAYNGLVEPFSKNGIRPGMFLSALRTTSISLDSAHQRVDNLLDSVAKPRGIHCAVIDFTRATLEKDDTRAPMTDMIYQTLGMNSMRQDETSPQSLQAVFTQALGIGTWFKIKPNEQETLLKAGENATHLQNITPGSQPKLLKEMREIQAVF